MTNKYLLNDVYNLPVISKSTYCNFIHCPIGFDRLYPFNGQLSK